MSVLIVYLDGEEQSQHMLEKESIVIGRRAGNDIQLLHPTVSGTHAKIVTIRGDSFIEDLDSTNGVRINGNKVGKGLLKDGDEIRIGKFTLRFVDDATLASISLPPVPGGMQSIVHDTAWSGSSLGNAETVMVPPKAMDEKQLGVLAIIEGPGSGKELLLNRTLTTLGKPGVQVAVITRRSDGYFLAQVEGNGMLKLNDKSTKDAGPLKAGDKLEVAGTCLRFNLRPA